nr:hypothetical protein Iba_chr11aCG13340 [Ipomoea batatas]GMD52590.1 hypothetical protein Iba_chr11bCG13080 [Ipomoea batatas]GMD54318.1 hypothetical protein Iba_chr11cCG11010 [Ipomoea batatas]GMD55786.1 hypothetical protein Iba_chr11dCG11310 [Ipomoea batatas]
MSLPILQTSVCLWPMLICDPEYSTRPHICPFLAKVQRAQWGTLPEQILHYLDVQSMSDLGVTQQLQEQPAD